EWSVSGAIRLRVPSLLLVTHTEPSPTAIPFGALPTGIVSTTLLTVGFICETVSLRLFATHTAPAPTAIPLGFEPTGMVCSTACECGSIRTTVLSLVVAHTAPRPAASDVGEAPTDACPMVEPPDGLIAPTESTASTDRERPPPVDVT